MTMSKPENTAAQQKDAADRDQATAPPAPPTGATPSRPKEVLSEMEQDLPSAKGEQPPERKAERRPRDNRRIVQGVQFPAGAGIETISGDRPEDLDRLEARMTPEQCEYLKQQGAIEGDWSPAGKPTPPMVGSRAELATRAVKLGPSPDHAEVERLRAENQQLKAQQGLAADKAKK
jgi:hypothetical protein